MKSNINIVETRNVRAVKNAVRDTVLHNSILAVIGDVGIGKTTMFNVLKSFWESNPHKFTPIEIKCFKSRYSRISGIMDLLIQSLSPDSHIPIIIEKKYIMLRELLQEPKKHIVLIADEAQDLNMQTYRDIKKIHEITNDGNKKFAVVFFGKTHIKWKTLLETPELGQRMHYLKLEELSQEELGAIAEQTFNLRFSNEKTKERFVSAMIHRTPLDVEYAARAIRHFYGIPNEQQAVVSGETITNLSTLTLKYQVNLAGITMKEIANRASIELNRTVSRQRVSEHFNGHRFDEEIDRITREMLDRHYTGSEKTGTL